MSVKKRDCSRRNNHKSGACGCSLEFQFQLLLRLLSESLSTACTRTSPPPRFDPNTGFATRRRAHAFPIPTPGLLAPPGFATPKQLEQAWRGQRGRPSPKRSPNSPRSWLPHKSWALSGAPRTEVGLSTSPTPAHQPTTIRRAGLRHQPTCASRGELPPQAAQS